jgi:phage shock protein PspC (stress-responsive transcriptional regulator)
MKEITRIHIAKVAYDVELVAKKDLEAYLKTLEAYSNDTEIIEDIEIRITEILAERGVKKSGVIAEADVKALMQQLGEPREFMTDGDIAVGPEDEAKLTADSVRKLYRNTDNAILGGVLSGVASFFKIDAIWMRLAFVVLLFASFGTALLVYVVLWIAVPPARTAADKLQMAGRAVTVGSIREINENEATRPISHGDEATRRAFTIIAGIICIISATGALLGTVAVVMAVIAGGQHHVLTENAPGGGFIFAAFILAIVSGLLLTVLFILGSYASFTQKMTRRVLISICAVIVLGLVSFSTAVGLVQYGSFVRTQTIQANTRESAMTLPTGIETVSSLKVDDSQNLDVTYVVTNDKPSATLKTVLRDGVIIPQPTVTVEGGVLHIDATRIVDKNCDSMWWCERSRQSIVIHGPALKQLTANEASTVSYGATEQDILTVVAERSANVTVSSGMIKALKVTAREDATVAATVATIQTLEADVRISAQVEAGIVQNLIVTDLESCPTNMREARIGVADVASNVMTLNGVSQPAHSNDSGCTEIEIQREDNE